MIKYLTFIIMLFNSVYANAHDEHSVVVDLSDNLVKVTTKYDGAEVLLFGAIEGNDDIVITVKGPNKNFLARKKFKKNGIWLSEKGKIIKNIPAFYYVTSNKKIDKKSDFVNFEKLKKSPKKLKKYRDAVFETQKRNGLFNNVDKNVNLIERKLFRTDLKLPSNAPLGDYLVEIFLTKGKKIIDKKSITLKISQVGLEAKISEFSHKMPFLYGIFCVLTAIFMGFLANHFFAKR
jgi:uncharacterized protein (TIGR02186 family)